MRLKLCDVCKGEVKGDLLTINYGFVMADICKNCSQDILKFLKKHKLISSKQDRQFILSGEDNE